MKCHRGQQTLRVYGGMPGCTAILWGQDFRVCCTERLELHDFPFDHQDLSMEFKLNDPASWERFDLHVYYVQFNLQVLLLKEWEVLSPVVERISPEAKFTRVSLRVRRVPDYYIMNVVLVMFGLSLLGLLSYRMEISDVANRVIILLTLILTSVSFKFILAGSLPKVRVWHARGHCGVPLFLTVSAHSLGCLAICVQFFNLRTFSMSSPCIVVIIIIIMYSLVYSLA